MLINHIINVFKYFFCILIFVLLSLPANSEMSVEEIIKGRKALFSKNYSTAKRVQALASKGEFDKAKSLMIEMSENYKTLLEYFPDNSKEGFKTEALPLMWENKKEFNDLMKKASSNNDDNLIISSDAFFIKSLNSFLFSQIKGRASVLKPSFELSGKYSNKVL